MGHMKGCRMKADMHEIDPRLSSMASFPVPEILTSFECAKPLKSSKRIGSLSYFEHIFFGLSELTSLTGSCRRGGRCS
jgi:hypothetical protein